MKFFRKKEKKKIISSWKGINIDTYNRLSLIKQDVNDENIVFKVLAVLYDKTFDEILNMPLDEVSEMSDGITFLQSRPKKTLVKKKYKLGDKTYVFTSDIDEITTSQYIDFQNLFKPETPTEVLLSIFLVPEGKKYGEEYDIKDVQDDVRKYMNVEEALSITDFFSIRLQLSTLRQIRRMKKALKMAKKKGILTPEQETQMASYGLTL